ncbi:alkylmercury lyase [Citrifermentans bemidjiense Bem]|uniref:Alkylmercury lyase n=1 Tax=Citrifermentans bemidjiense (strain ATCC BAA-1014 / DSM 16622 / JCM 12645 / Bem) TaxID=404380 RepID=B5EAP1_CITBB|nr:organomercurial lyase MerB [Citrifermentans bemidjiense]ACH37350.1 alkylmercury lyase [Citrifermentans bemidjiense Bem]
MAGGTLHDVLAGLHCDHPRVWLFLLRALAKGRPVSRTTIANALNSSLSEIEAALASFADTVYDEKGDVVACGLSLMPTPHSFTVCGNQLYTWCALDALMYPVALEQVAQVESHCPVTGIPVRMTATPTGVVDPSPAGVSLSMVAPSEQAGCCSVRNSFCSGVHFISSAEAAASWLSLHPEASIVSLEEAWQIGHAVMQQRLSHGETSRP